MNDILFSINSVAPVFILVVIGIILRLTGLIDESLVSKISSIVFTIAIPALIFSKIAQTRFSEVFDRRIVLLIVLGAIGFFALSWVLSILFIKKPETRGPFIQGTMRGNNAIISLAIILNLYGESGISKGAIAIAFLMPLYNVLSVIALTVPMHQSGTIRIGSMVKKIATNPLIIGVVLAVPFSAFEIEIPLVLDRSLGYLAQMTLPLALLNIGASLRRTRLSESAPTIAAACIKTIVYPATITLIAAAVGLRGENLSIVFLITGAPTAVASFIMARAMHNDSETAANIIALTTLVSIFTIGSGLFILRTMGLI